jgi:phosphohistidine phosphatase
VLHDSEIDVKTLLVMRHAKSDWGEADFPDHERPLAPRGIKAARRMGRLLHETGAAPELVVSSTAVRALTTAELAAKAGGWDCAIITEVALYASDPDRVLEVVARVDSGVRRLLIAGHEPTSSELVRRLTGGVVRMPTAAVACLDLADGGWAELGPGRCTLRWLVTPKMLE